MALIRRSFKFLSEITFVPLYKALVRSHLDYAVSVWAPYELGMVDELEKVQRRATKMLPGFRDIPYEDRLRRLKLPTLAYRRIRADAIETYKILKEIYDPEVAITLDNNQNHHLRGHNLKLEKKRYVKQQRKNSFRLRTVDIWNSLPSKVVNATNLNTFKKRLDRLWENQDLLYSYRSKIDFKKYVVSPAADHDNENCL